MRKHRKTRRQRAPRIQPATRPTVLTLLAHILASAFSGGILLIFAFGCALLAFLYYNNFSPDNLLVLLFGTIIVLAFYRGCLAWQQDLSAYHSRMSDIRHTPVFKTMDRR